MRAVGEAVGPLDAATLVGELHRDPRQALPGLAAVGLALDRVDEPCAGLEQPPARVAPRH